MNFLRSWNFDENKLFTYVGVSQQQWWEILLKTSMGTAKAVCYMGYLLFRGCLSMTGQLGLSELSFISWVSVKRGVPLSPSLPSPVFLPVLQPAESVLWSLPHHMRSLHSFPAHQESACEHSPPTTLLETCPLH